jgi:AcrR family transcriptional regulator
MPRRPGLDRAAVVRAAADLVNAEGIEALTVGRLASLLGIQPPSLYNHVGGLPDVYRELALLNASALADRLTGAAVGRAGGDAVHAIAQAYRGYIKESPGVYLSSLRSSLNRQEPDPALEAAEERAVRVVVAVVASFGLHGDDAIHGARALRSAVHGFTTLEIAGGFGIPIDLDESFTRLIDALINGLIKA